ncbi:MAG: ribulose-phosphate 3-epimerase [Patescibacteria group bacterium]
MLIPAILAKSQKEFKSKLEKILPFSDFIQLDIMDGKFVPNKTWGNPKALADLSAVIDFEVHLMVENPEKAIEKWAKAGAERIVFHFEATDNPEKCIEKIKAGSPRFGRVEAGIAINPETPVLKIKPFIKKIDYVLVMGVTPGFSGQKFQSKVLAKIKAIRKLAPKIKIGVDGGVGPENAKKIKNAGAKYLCAASGIFNSENTAKAIKDLKI